METSKNSQGSSSPFDDPDHLPRSPSKSHTLRNTQFSSSSSSQGTEMGNMHSPLNKDNHGGDPAHKQSMFDLIEAENKKRIKVWGPFHKFWIKTVPPQGQFHGVWDFILLVLVIVSALWEPYNVSFFFENPRSYWFEIVIDIFFYVDIVVSFWTSYDTGYKLEKDKTKIAINYLKGWFVIDFISTMNWEVFVAEEKDHSTLIILGILKLVKVFRLFRVARLVERLTMTINTDSSFIEAYKFFLYVFLVAHFLGCFFFLTPSLSGDVELGWRASRTEAFPEFGTDVSLQYITCLYWAFTTMTTIGYGDICPGTHAEVIFVIFAEVIGLCFFAILLTQINMVNESSNKTNLINNKRKDDVISFIKQSAISKDVKDALMTKVREFLRFKTKSRFHTFSHNDPRFDCLSYALRDEIRQHVFLPALERIQMFGDKEEKAALDALMEKLDTDEVKGFIDDEEFEKLCSDTNLDMSMDDIQAAMNEMGKDENGQVSAQAFKEWYHFLKYGVPQLTIPPPFTTMLASRLKVMAFSPDDVIVPQGKYGLTFFIVLSGSVHVHKRKYIDPNPKKNLATHIKALKGMTGGSYKNLAAALRASEARKELETGGLTPRDESMETPRDQANGGAMDMSITNMLEQVHEERELPAHPTDAPDAESSPHPSRQASPAVTRRAPPKKKKEVHKVTPLLPQLAEAAAKEEEEKKKGRVADNDSQDDMADAKYMAGESNHTVKIKHYYRYPVFGLPSCLPPALHQVMKDRCRRWEVVVKQGHNRAQAKETGCCDVAYIDRYEIMQIFHSMWDDGPAHMAHFVNHHYNVQLSEDAYSCLDGLNTEDYERRRRMKNLSEILQNKVRDKSELKPDDNLGSVDGTITQLSETMLTSYQLTEERCKNLASAIAAVSARM